MTRSILITGGAKRLGRAVALHFAAEGYDIAIHYRGSEAEAKLVRDDVARLGQRAELYQADLHDPDQTDALLPRVLADFPDLEGLVNSASVFDRDKFGGITREFLHGQARINAEAPLMLTQAFWNLGADGGWVLNLIDSKVDQITPAFISYTLSKLALVDVTRMTARACAPKLRVNAIAPGLVLRSGKQTDEEFAQVHDQVPLQKGPTAEDIAKMVLNLANAPSTTGQIITVDGGLSFYSPKSAGML